MLIKFYEAKLMNVAIFKNLFPDSTITAQTFINDDVKSRDSRIILIVMGILKTIIQ